MKIIKITASQTPLDLKNLQSVITKKGYSPFIQNGTWWEYDETLKGYVDTGIVAEGKDGYTPVKGVDYNDGLPGKEGKDFRYEDFTPEQLEALKGAKGEKGENGLQGIPGIRGEKGDPGEIGPQGERGEKGDKGDPGQAGLNGYTPVKGVDYFTYSEIEAFKKDVTPVKGVDYNDGIDGIPGKDFRYEDFTPEQLEALKGAKGEKGERGEKGEPGETGPQGERGEKGEKGDKGDPGSTGKDGYTPVKGVDYNDGMPGKDGVSPTLSVTEIKGGHRISITDSSGTKYVDIKDGADASITRDAIVSALGYTPYRNGDIIDSKVLRGGINSIINNSSAVSINQSINGAGYIVKRGGSVVFCLDGYDMKLTDSSAELLFDGKSSTYVNFANPMTVCSKEHLIWSEDKTYRIGAYVAYYDNGGTSGIFRWYKATKENIGVIPLNDATGAWKNASNTETGQYVQYVDLTGVEITLELTFPINIRYENGLSLYWRASGQWADHIKVEKIGDDGTLVVVDDGTDTIDSIIQTYYMAKYYNDSVDQHKLRLTFTIDNKKSWMALTQIAVTGIVGGIEGTLVNRGGSSMYGDLIPYKNSGPSLGSDSFRWYRILANELNTNGYLKIGNTTLNESQLKALLAKL